MTSKKGFVRPATSADVPLIAEDMRPADMAEVKAFSGVGPKRALFSSLRNCQAEVACLPNGVPVAMYGTVSSGVPNFGVIWMLAANQFHKLQVQFIRECCEHLDRISHPYRAVFNYTDARNTVHHRWLKWCGFTFINRHEQFGCEGRPFYEFVKITED